MSPRRSHTRRRLPSRAPRRSRNRSPRSSAPGRTWGEATAFPFARSLGTPRARPRWRRRRRRRRRRRTSASRRKKQKPRAFFPATRARAGFCWRSRTPPRGRGSWCASRPSTRTWTRTTARAWSRFTMSSRVRAPNGAVPGGSRARRRASMPSRFCFSTSKCLTAASPRPCGDRARFRSRRKETPPPRSPSRSPRSACFARATASSGLGRRSTSPRAWRFASPLPRRTKKMRKQTPPPSRFPRRWCATSPATAHFLPSWTPLWPRCASAKRRPCTCRRGVVRRRLRKTRGWRCLATRSRARRSTARSIACVCSA